MLSDKGGAFGRALHAVLIRALPLDDGPGFVSHGCHASEDLLEVHLAVAQGTEAARPLPPRQVRSIHARARRRPVLGIFHVEGFDLRSVDVNESHVVHALQDEVRRVVVDGHARMIARRTSSCSAWTTWDSL